MKLSPEIRAAVLEMLKTTPNRCAVARHFGLQPTQVRRIVEASHKDPAIRRFVDPERFPREKGWQSRRWAGVDYERGVHQAIAARTGQQ